MDYCKSIILPLYTLASGKVKQQVTAGYLLSSENGGPGESLERVTAALLPVVKIDALEKIKNRHSSGLLKLAGSPKPAEIATYPRKAYFVEKNAAGNLTEEDRALLKTALSSGDTVDNYLSRTAARIAAYDKMWTFAEGFKGRGNDAVTAALKADDWQVALTETMAEIMQGASDAEKMFREAMAGA